MPAPFKVALLIETSSRYGRDLLYGVRDWIREAGPWAVRLVDPGGSGGVPPWMLQWDGHGVIARVDSAAISAGLRRTGLPVVDVSAERSESVFPRVSVDNAAVARLAATHLRGKGFPHLGFCADPRFIWSRQREGYFRTAAAAEGLPVHCFTALPRGRKPAGGGDPDLAELAAWIAGLPKPIGIFACFDRRAQQVLEACLHLGIPVPDAVGVVGVDDDEVFCELCSPPLSSILPSARRTGYEAARMLAAMMAGREPDRRTRLVEPVGVIERQSTDVFAVADRKVAAALRYMRDHACAGIHVADVLRAVPMSRTLFDLRFKQLLGHTPHQHLLRIRLGRAQQLLATSQLSVAVVAELSGFGSTAYFSAAFRRETALTPQGYRSQHRTGASGPTAAEADVEGDGKS